MSINSTRNKNLNLTSTNIANRLLLGRCCYADYAIDFLQKKNIGDNEQANCYLNKMKQLYYSMQALRQYIPSSELSSTTSSSFGSSPETGDFIFYADGEQISSEITISSTPGATAIITAVNDINLYQEDYIASVNSNIFTITSATSGSDYNGVVITLTRNGSLYATGTLSGGGNQWCLDDTKAQKILDNIDQLCGCPCDCDDNILTDIIPKYIN